MAGFFEALKIISVPALIAAFIYLSTTFVVLPLVRRHRDRYDQYVPVDSIRQTTSIVRSRVVNTAMDLFSRVFLRRRRTVEVADEHESQDGDDYAFGEEEGETMVGFDLSQRERSGRGGDDVVHSDTRLSRDLEEGFKDDSEEDLIDDRATAVRNT